MEEVVQKVQNKLSIGTILGYGSGSIGEAMLFNFYQVFFMFFLTNVAGVNPALAGTVTLIAVICSAVADPVMGYISDNTAVKNGQGRRRRYILWGTIPMVILYILMFSVFNLSAGAKVVYYAIIACCVWISYAVVQVPYSAFGAELTADYNERTKLRTVTGFLVLAGDLVAMSTPMIITGKLMAGGTAPQTAWLYVAAGIAAASGLSLIVTYVTGKGKELTEFAPAQKGNFIKEYWGVLKLKPVKWPLLASMTFTVAYTMVNSVMVYYMIYALGIPQTAISLVMTIYLLTGFALTPIIGFIASKIGKKNMMIASMIISAIGMLVFITVGIQSLPAMIAYMCVFGVAVGGFYTLVIAMLYDICEVDEYKNGKRREGILMALGSFVQKLGGAVASQILGLVLLMSHYNPAAPTQTPEALKGITSAFVLYPAIVVVITAIFFAAFPITGKTYGVLLRALDAKRQGKEHTTEGLERIV